MDFLMIDTLPETNSSHLKITGSKISYLVSFWGSFLAGVKC